MSEIKFACPACGQHLACESTNAGQQIPCPTCQATVTVPSPPPPRLGVAAPTLAVPPALPANAPRPARPLRTSRLAIVSLVCSCAGLAFGFFGTIPGIICGAKALRQIKNTPGLGGKGMATAGLVTGCVLSVLWIPLSYILVVATISGFNAVAKMKAGQGGTSTRPGAVAINADVTANLTLDGSAWRPDLEGVAIPDAVVSGRIQGLPFTVQKVEVDPRFRTIEFSYDNSGVEGSSAAWKQISLTLRFDDQKSDSLSPAEFYAQESFGKYSRRTLLVQKDDTASVEPPADWSFTKPGINMTWLEPGPKPVRDRMNSTANVPYPYVMRLEFGELQNGKIPGRIYLCVLDRKKSFICGKFFASVPLDANLPPDIKPDAAGWTLDVNNAPIPDTLVAGRLGGIPFKTQAVELGATFGKLTFRQGAWPDEREVELDLHLPRSGGHDSIFATPARLSGQTLTVTGKEAFGEQTRLSLKPLSLGMNQKYVMRLEFGEFKDGKLPGRIYLCLLDRGKSFIRGKFVVVPK